MSKLRPSQRDLIEARYIALVEARDMPKKEYEEELLDLQRQLDRIETPRLRDGEREKTAREDGLERAGQIASEDGPAEFDEGGQESVFSGADETVDWHARCRRMTAFAVGILRLITAPEEDRPKLKAFEGLLAMGADCQSMRAVAEIYSLTPERISQRVEALQKRFNFPKNQHNKSPAAVKSYQAVAQMRRGAA